MQWFVRHAFRTPEQAADPRIALVGQAHLSRLPPATVLLAGIDPLRSEGELYATKLKGAGNDVLVHLWRGVTHEFFGLGALLPEALEAQELAGQRLREAFERRVAVRRHG